MSHLWPRSLFGRLFALQLVSLVAVFLVFGGLVLRDQSRANARLVAPIWAAAVQSRLTQAADDATASGTEVVATEVKVTLGQPPSDARYPELFARYNALIRELGNAGLDVRRVALSSQDNITTTWLEVITAPGRTRWVGISEDLETASLWGSTGLGLLLALGIVVVSAWWMSHNLILPLTQLKTAMRTYAETGTAVTLTNDSGPTETREMATQFSELVAQREQNERTREVMLAGISHDLRSPLGRIRVGAELLPDDAANRTWKKVIVDNVVLVDHLLESFMDYARAQQLTLDSEVDVHALVTQQCSLHGIPVEEAGELPRPLVVAPASAIGLERVISNLLDNAQKYGKPPINVSIAARDANAVIVVTDHGPGIASTQIDQMAQPFHRGQSHRNTPGTGLGLAIVRETIRHHGGRVQLRNTPSGFSVEVRLPCQSKPG